MAALQRASDTFASDTTNSIAPEDNKPSERKAETFETIQQNVWRSEADSIIEKYGQWSLDCQRVETGRRCSISQRLGNQLGMEVLQSDTQDSVKALILLPFGLAVSEGITLFIDNKPADHRIPFSTCGSEGCIVPMVVSQKSMEQILQGSQLKIISFDAISSERKEYSIPLEGISRAYLRLKSYRGL